MFAAHAWLVLMTSPLCVRSVSIETWRPGTFWWRRITWWKSLTLVWPETCTTSTTTKRPPTWVLPASRMLVLNGYGWLSCRYVVWCYECDLPLVAVPNCLRWQDKYSWLSGVKMHKHNPKMVCFCDCYHNIFWKTGSCPNVQLTEDYSNCCRYSWFGVSFSEPCVCDWAIGEVQ